MQRLLSYPCTPAAAPLPPQQRRSARAAARAAPGSRPRASLVAVLAAAQAEQPPAGRARCRRTKQQSQQQHEQQQAGWDYKYRHQPCASGCAPGDVRCRQLEALVQSVLSFPNLPVRLVRVLPALSSDMGAMTALVEAMAGHFGKELTLMYLSKQPRLLDLRFDTLLARVGALKELASIRDNDVPTMLRKAPALLLFEPAELRLRYEAIPRLVQFSAAQVRFLVLKFPKVLEMPPEFVRTRVERLRQLCYTREEWARDYDTISPSLLAYFLRDANDQIMRLEYLASTGERPEWQLREVMKPANRSFRGKLRNFAQWELRVKQRRAAQRAEVLAARQAASRAAAAAAIKAELLAADGGGGGSGAGEQQQQQQQQQAQQAQQQQQQQQAQQPPQQPQEQHGTQAGQQAGQPSM